MTATEVVALLRARKVSPAELVEASLARIAAVESAINAVVTTCPDRARAAADACDSAALLAGLPIGIKDLTDVAGVLSTQGTLALADHLPEASDPLVTRLEARGGIVIGKTNTPEMGAGGNTFNAVFGPTRNPWNTARNAGGSSGGAAASLATGELWLSHGSDYGGSLRTPANYCGIVGLRPSPGVAAGGGFAPEPVQGPMARNVADCALFLDALAGFDPIWPLSRPAPDLPYADACQVDPGTIHIGFSADLGGFAPVETSVRSVLSRALAHLSAPDTSVDEVAPNLDGLDQTFRTLRGVHFAADALDTDDHIRQHYKSTLRTNIAQGFALTATDIAQAALIKKRLFDTLRRFFARFDVLACAVNGLPPGPIEEEFPAQVDGHPMRDYLDWLQFSFLATVCGLPALSLPVGFTDDGLPVGLQLIGPPRGEARLLQISRRFEERLALPATPIDPVIRHKPDA